MSLELHALLDEGQVPTSQSPSHHLDNHIQNVNAQPNVQGLQDQPSTSTTSTNPQQRRSTTNKQHQQQQQQQQRKETHLELLRYPGWNYFLNLNSEATILFYLMAVTTIRFTAPLCYDVYNFCYYLITMMFFPDFLAITNNDASNTGIHDPYAETNPVIASTTHIGITTHFFTLRSIFPFISALIMLLVYTQIPHLKRYIKVHQSVNINTSMPFPPPAIYLTHLILYLAVALACDFLTVPYFEYSILYEVYLKLPTIPTGSSDFIPIVFQGFMIIFYLVLVLLTLCLSLLMLTECFCIYKTQQWWLNYTQTFQTKKRCFILGNYNQINLTRPISMKSLPLYFKIYFHWFKAHLVYAIKTTILRQKDVQPPTIFPYPLVNKGKFTRYLYSKFPSLQRQHQQYEKKQQQQQQEQLSKTKVDGSPDQKEDNTCSHGCSHNDGLNHNHNNNHEAHDIPETLISTTRPTDPQNDHDDDDDNDDDGVTEDLKQQQSLLAPTADTPTLVIPCVVLPPFLYPFQHPLLKMIWDGFAVQVVEWIKSYRDSIQRVHDSRGNISHDEFHNGPAIN